MRCFIKWEVCMNYLDRVYNFIRGRVLLKKGYSSYYINYCSKDLKNGYKKSILPKKEKRWAYKRGFFPWRIAQYGLTDENWTQIISDRDYFYLHPINNQYSRWIDDKLTMKYVLAPFDSFLPKYYYHLLKDRDVMRLMDCPSEFGCDYADVIALLEKEHKLAAKMVAGTHGIGFYKLEQHESMYCVNGKDYSKERFTEFLKTLDDYVITEFIEMHPMIKKINPGSVNTIRITVINESGSNPIAPFAYFRIGTSKSGIVDNVAQGGMVCKIEVETGRYYDGQYLQDHIYYCTDIHPDTKEKLEGVLPNWNIVIKTVLEIARYCPQLKWLGFDIAITDEGFKIIEINSHHELHKPHEYPREVNDFLFTELDKKRKKYHVK